MATEKTVKSNPPRLYPGWRPPWLVFAYEAYQHRIIRPKNGTRKLAHRYELHRIPLADSNKTVVGKDHICKECSERKAPEQQERLIPSWLDGTSDIAPAKSLRPPWSTPFIKHAHLSSTATHSPPHNHQHHYRHHSRPQSPSHIPQYSNGSPASHIVEETNKVTGRVYASMQRPHVHDFEHLYQPHWNSNTPLAQHQLLSHPVGHLPYPGLEASPLVRHTEHAFHAPRPPILPTTHIQGHQPLHNVVPPPSPYRSLCRADHSTQPGRAYCHHHHHNHNHPSQAQHLHQNSESVMPKRSEPGTQGLRKNSLTPTDRYRHGRH